MANPEGLESVAAAPISGGDFSNLVASMSRLLRGLARMQVFSGGKVGLAEWIALSVLTERPSASGKVLARRMGVGGSRADELVTSLAAANLVAIDQNEGSGPGEVSITEAGKAEVEALNSRLGSLLSTTLGGKERAVAIASKQIRIIGRILNGDSPERGSGKEKKKAKKAEPRSAED